MWHIHNQLALAPYTESTSDEGQPARRENVKPYGKAGKNWTNSETVSTVIYSYKNVLIPL